MNDEICKQGHDPAAGSGTGGAAGPPGPGGGERCAGPARQGPGAGEADRGGRRVCPRRCGCAGGPGRGAPVHPGYRERRPVGRGAQGGAQRYPAADGGSALRPGGRDLCRSGLRDKPGDRAHCGGAGHHSRGGDRRQFPHRHGAAGAGQHGLFFQGAAAHSGGGDGGGRGPGGGR